MRLRGLARIARRLRASRLASIRAITRFSYSDSPRNARRNRDPRSACVRATQAPEARPLQSHGDGDTRRRRSDTDRVRLRRRQHEPDRRARRRQHRVALRVLSRQGGDLRGVASAGGPDVLRRTHGRTPTRKPTRRHPPHRAIAARLDATQPNPLRRLGGRDTGMPSRRSRRRSSKTSSGSRSHS